jgi:hypothetical protein
MFPLADFLIVSQHTLRIKRENNKTCARINYKYETFTFVIICQWWDHNRRPLAFERVLIAELRKQVNDFAGRSVDPIHCRWIGYHSFGNRLELMNFKTKL